MEFTENDSFIPHREPPLKQDDDSLDKAGISEVTNHSDAYYEGQGGCIMLIILAIVIILCLIF